MCNNMLNTLEYVYWRPKNMYSTFNNWEDKVFKWTGQYGFAAVMNYFICKTYKKNGT